ncbi:MAG: glycosyltransferase family 4 protein [Bacteroidales bacterium]|nr:glycosyltransferase family 4 protein [Bacteroidales bacterium]
MNICFFNSKRAWGGGEKWHFDMASALLGKGYRVVLIAGIQSDLMMKARTANIPCYPVKVTNISFLNIIKVLKLVRFFRQQKYETIIINLSADLKLAGISAKMAGIRNIIYRRGSAIPVRNTLFNRFLFHRIITGIIANSDETKRTILQNNSKLFPRENMITLYNGVNLEALDSQPVIKMFDRKENEVVIGNAGRLVHQKGQRYLVELASILNREGIDFRIVVAGNGPLEPQLKQMALQAGVQNRITFLGFVVNIKAFMEYVDIFVLTSLWEGFGYVLIEAMACRKPVVAFNTSSNPEIIVQNETGYLVGLKNMEEMAAMVDKLIKDRPLREAMGQKGRKRVEEAFDIKVSQSRFESFLRNL